jgi:uncharacterized protein (DUF433 family)/DNA-binding transcriptional MerR regulator
VGYPPTIAAALSGATVYQLRQWRSPRTPLLVPEVSAERPICYSFRDLLALRTFLHLRQHASLQQIRKAIGNLSDLTDLKLLPTCRLASDPRGNIQLIQGGEAAAGHVRHPGRLQLLVGIGDVIEPFPVRAGVVVPPLLKPRPYLSVDPETQGGTPVIRGTRVPYDAVAGLMRDRVPAEKISDYYPSVTADAARDAFDFAAYVDSYDLAA